MSEQENINTYDEDEAAANAIVPLPQESGDEKRYSHAEATAEALLFAAGDGLTIEEISLVLRRKHKDTERILEGLAERYDKAHSGIMLRNIDNKYQLMSRPELYEELRVHFDTVINAPLSRAALEALTIIAYNQPITRGGIEIIRGVNSDAVLTKLIERGLVCEKGRSDSPGRPTLYGTTELFLRSTGLSSLEDLSRFDPKVNGVEQSSGTDAADSQDSTAAINDDTSDSDDMYELPLYDGDGEAT